MSKSTKRTVSSAMREYVLAGLTNEEIWDLCQAEFDLSDSKKHYPAWYRCELRSKLGSEIVPKAKRGVVSKYDENIPACA